MDIVKSDIVPLHGAAISMTGGRPENQDDMAYLDTPLGFLIVVCDGMGGGPGGKTASYIVKHQIVETICECSPQTPREHALKMAAARAHQVLEEKMQENPYLNGMGSTFVAALFNDQSAVIAHTGDSRCYRLHGTKYLFRTQDHSLVAELVSKKVMTEEEARQSPQANVITRGLGSTTNHVPEIDEIPYKKGDRFVLCTDGVWGAMQHYELIKIFTQPKDLQQLLSDISTQVDKIGFSKGGGHDNHTIAMFELEKESLLKDKGSVINKILLAIILLCVLAVVMFTCIEGITRHNNSSNGNTQYTRPIKIMNSPGTIQEKQVPKKTEAKSKPEQDTGLIANSIYNKDSVKKEIDAIISTDYVEEKTSDEKGSNQKTAQLEITPKKEDIPQEIIDYLLTAKDLKSKNLKTAISKMAKIKNKVMRLTESLAEKTTNKRALHSIAKFRKDVSQEKLWWINGVKSAEGFYCALYPNIIKKYSDDMDKIKQLLKQENNN